MKTNLELSVTEKVGKAFLDGLGTIIHGIRSLECTEPDYPSTAVLLDVPGLCQVSTYTCGITSTWSIIASFGLSISINEWFHKCHKAGCHPDEGMDIVQIKMALRYLNLKVYTKRYAGADQIKKYIDSGQPILFGQGSEMFDDGDHWMYIYGYSARYIFVGNVVNPLYPIRSKARWTWMDFERELNPRKIYIITP